MDQQELTTALETADYALHAAGIDAARLQQLMRDNPEQISIETDENGDFRLFDPFQLVAYAAPRDPNGWTSWALAGE